MSDIQKGEKREKEEVDKCCTAKETFDIVSILEVALPRMF